MNITEYKQLEEHIQQRLSPKRFSHTQGVVKAAIDLALHYGIDGDQAKIAALLHDCMKESPLEEMRFYVNRLGLSLDEEILSNGALLHGPAGAGYAYEVLHVTDPSILHAIQVHTMGSVSMSLLDKIIFLADYIEPGRDFPGVDKLRVEAFNNLNQAILDAYDGTIRHLLDLGLTIHVDTIRGRNSIVLAMKG